MVAVNPIAIAEFRMYAFLHHERIPGEGLTMSSIWSENELTFVPNQGAAWRLPDLQSFEVACRLMRHQADADPYSLTKRLNLGVALNNLGAVYMSKHLYMGAACTLAESDQQYAAINGFSLEGEPPSVPLVCDRAIVRYNACIARRILGEYAGAQGERDFAVSLLASLPPQMNDFSLGFVQAAVDSLDDG